MSPERVTHKHFTRRAFCWFSQWHKTVAMTGEKYSLLKTANMFVVTLVSHWRPSAAVKCHCVIVSAGESVKAEPAVTQTS